MHGSMALKTVVTLALGFCADRGLRGLHPDVTRSVLADAEARPQATGTPFAGA
jgi:hypothetical protein